MICYRNVRRLSVTCVCACAALSMGAAESRADVSTLGPGWMVTANSFPTHIAPGAPGAIVVNVMNVGAGPSSGAITLTDVLPPGVTAVEAGELEAHKGLGGDGIAEIGHSFWRCAGNGPGSPPNVDGADVVSCTNTSELESIAGGGGNPGSLEGAHPDPQVAISIN